MATQDDLKREVARAAVRFVPQGQVIGVGTGSTADFFIDELGAIQDRIVGAVPSSERSAQRLAAQGNLPTLTFTPCAFASSSVRPTHATSGSV